MSLLSSKWKMPTSKAARTKLVPAVKSLISVLEEVDQCPALYLNQRILRQAIRRYEHIWIPLLANTPPSERLTLVPPLDVEWVWFCHMLCPVKYAADSAAIWRVSRPDEPDFLLDHKLLDGKERHNGKKRAKLAWEQRFPNEQFDIMTSIRSAPVQEDEVADQDGKDGVALKSNISYNIALAAGRQMAFHYQVAVMPQYLDDRFLRGAVNRYRKMFLKLQKRFPQEIWVPTYDIDVVWHAHIMHPRWYCAETKALRGSVLPHDDTLNDRSPGSALSNRWDATKARWHGVFDDIVTRNGGMWRGCVEGGERLLRPRVVSVIRDIEGRLQRSRETLFSVWHEERTSEEHLEGTDWVHRTDWMRRDPGSSKSSDDNCVMERYTFLAQSGERAPLLMCRVSHFVMCNTAGNPYTFCTTVEVYDRISLVHVDRRRYPLATAHHALPQTICVDRTLKNNVCSILPSETALVLRVGGEDFALLCGRWSAIQPPKKVAPGVSPNKLMQTKGSFQVPGEPGELILRMWLLGEKSVGRWIWFSRKGSRLEPGSFSFQLPNRDAKGIIVEDNVSFNLSDATITVGNMKNVIPGYLICMSVAVLHVALQPRFEPRGGVSSKSAETMYPAWCVRQKNYETLRGAGGEVLEKGRHVGLPYMRLSKVHKNLVPKGFFVGSVDDIGDPDTAVVD